MTPSATRQPPPTAIGALSRDEQISISALERLCLPGHNQAQNARVPLPVHKGHARPIPAIFQTLACAVESDPDRCNRSSLAIIACAQAGRSGSGGLIWIKE